MNIRAPLLLNYFTRGRELEGKGMKTLITSLLTFAAAAAFCQHIDWVKSTTLNKGTGKLICDASNNVYHYGGKFPITWNIQYYSAWDTSGSFIEKFDNDGNSIFSKHWPGRFNIKDIIYDGSNSFYFAGYFGDSHQINGNTIISRGHYDGMLGKMDLNGNILWLKTFGGPKGDLFNGLTFNQNKTSIIVSGGISDTLHVENNLVATETQTSIALIKFDLNGNYQSHKLYNFRTDISEINCALEIKTDPAGNYLMLAHREGCHPLNQCGAITTSGRYLYKLDPSLEIIWSSGVINDGCYYGNNCGGLSVSASGDAFVTKYCSGKYGGTPNVCRYNTSNGTNSWLSPPNDDGFYTATYADAQAMFVLGEEGANGCPCPSNHRGYHVIKKFDSQNNLLGETRLQNVLTLSSITKSPNGKLFVVGSTYYNQSVAGYSLQFNNSNHSNFIVRLSDINCAAVVKLDSGEFWRPEIFCDTLSLNAGPGISYLWNNGHTGQILPATSSGTYFVKVTQPTGCIAMSLPKIIEKKSAPHTPTIDIVTYDNNNGHYVVQWSDFDGTYPGPYSKSKIHRITNGTIQTDTVPDYNGQYVDTLSFIDKPSYALSFHDFCGQSSPLSQSHTPVYLSVIQQNNQNVLTWTNYQGAPVTGISVMYGNVYNMNHLATLPPGTNSYVVSGSGNFVYQILTTTGWRTSLSNTVAPAITVALSDHTNEIKNLHVYPVPSSNFIKLRYEGKQALTNCEVCIYDLSGRCVKTEKCKFNSEEEKTIGLTQLQSGTYFLTLKAGEVTSTRRIIIE